MENNHTRSERWIDGVIRDLARAAKLGMVWHSVVGVFACGVWWVCVVGTLSAIWFILSNYISLPNPFWVGLGMLALQFGLFPLIRRPATPGWEFGEDVDGALVITPPDHSKAADYIYNQDHDFSFKRTYVAIFFAGPIAFDEAWREWRAGKQLKRLDREKLAQLAEILAEAQHKLTFGEIRESWVGEDYRDAIEQSTHLPMFHLFSKVPQGIALTDTALKDLLPE